MTSTKVLIALAAFGVLAGCSMRIPDYSPNADMARPPLLLDAEESSSPDQAPNKAQ